jgi:hypothetical protein
VIRPTLPGLFTTNATVTAPNERNSTNNGPALGTLTVVQTCAHYNADGSAFTCDAGEFNVSASNNNMPSILTCCIKAAPNNTVIPFVIVKAYFEAILVVGQTTTLTIVVNCGKQDAPNTMVTATLPQTLELTQLPTGARYI